MLFRQPLVGPTCLPKVRALQAGTGKLPRAWVVSRAKFLCFSGTCTTRWPAIGYKLPLPVAGRVNRRVCSGNLIERRGRPVPANRMPTKSQKREASFPESLAPCATHFTCVLNILLVTILLVTVARMVGYHCGHQKLVLEVHMPQVNCTWGGGLLLQLLLPGPAAVGGVRTDQWEQMTLLLVD